MKQKSRLIPCCVRRLTMFIAALAVVFSLAACGKRSPLEPPPGYKAPESSREQPDAGSMDQQN